MTPDESLLLNEILHPLGDDFQRCPYIHKDLDSSFYVLDGRFTLQEIESLLLLLKKHDV